MEPIWQAGGGYDRNIYKDETFANTLEYIHFNPVRKGLVECPVDWKWSSARFYETREADPIEVDWPEWW
jgi:putative transposase